VKNTVKRFMRRPLVSFRKVPISSKFTEYGDSPQLDPHFEIANDDLAPLQPSLKMSGLQPFHKSVTSAPSGSRFKNIAEDQNIRRSLDALPRS
jgi:hypothetical protein